MATACPLIRVVCARYHHKGVVAALMATMVLASFCGMGVAQTTTGDCQCGLVSQTDAFFGFIFQVSQWADLMNSCMR